MLTPVAALGIIVMTICEIDYSGQEEHEGPEQEELEAATTV